MPRGYAFVMTAATVPTVTLIACAIGLGVSLRGRDARDPGTTLLWLLAPLVQYAAWLRPTTPIFGGTKHWLTAYPFLVLFAGVGVAWAAGAARRLWLRRSGLELEVLFATSALVPPAAQALHAHPWGLSAYVPLFGGAPGAATLGLNRGFWGYTTDAIAPYLDELPPGARVYVHDTAGSAWDMLQRDRRVRRDLRGVWHVGEAEVSLYHHEQHMAVEEYQAWVAFGTTRPDHVAGLDGVPVIWAYRRR
jgi:hypothetical protein